MYLHKAVTKHTFTIIKKIFFIFFLSLVSFSLHAQTGLKELPLVIGLYAPYISQPGGKIATYINLKQWSKKNPEEENAFEKANSLYVSPQVGAFVRPGNHNSLLLNADVGFKHLKRSRFFTAYSIGIGYLNTFQIISETIDLGSGETIGTDRERKGYFLPTINFELGKEAKKRIGWYSKLSYGRNVSTKQENSAFFALEFGLSIHLKKAEE